MTARLAVGDRVRHSLLDEEGVVVDVLRVDRLPGVEVSLDVGGRRITPMGEWQRLPGYGSMDRRAAE